MSIATHIDQLRQDIADLNRRLSNIVTPGVIAAVDPGAARCRLQAGSLVTGWVPWLTMRAGADRSWWCPSVGEQAVLIAPDGEPNQGWIIPAGYSQAAPAPDNDPANHVVEYADGIKIVHEPGRLVLDAWDAEGTVEIRAKNIILKTGEEGMYHLDHAGMASRITHLDGPNYKSESWATGAIVTPEPDHGHNPPEVEINEEDL